MKAIQTKHKARQILVTLAAVVLLLGGGSTTAFAYYEKDPSLEYIRAAYDVVNQLEAGDGTVVTEAGGTIEVQSNRPNLAGLLYSSSGETDASRFNGKDFVEDATWLAMSGIAFSTDGFRTKGTTDNQDRILNLTAIMNLKDEVSYREAEELAQTVAMEIRSQATSERQMVELANQYLIDHVVYPKVVDESVESLWTAYGALANGEAVCQGYSYAFHLLMRDLDIPVVNVFGTADGENHVWNQVLVDGEWLYVDVTFNDPVISGRRPSASTLALWNAKYLLLTEKEFYRDKEHIADYYDSGELAKDVFYRNRVEAQAEELREAGLFLGDDSGFRLSDGLTRAEMAVMLTRVVGGTEEVLANPTYYSERCTFTDVPDWAKPYVGYCYENGLVVGVGNNRYGSDLQASKLDYCTVLLRATGVTTGYTYRTSDVKAVELGYLTLGRAAFADLTRGDVVFMTHQLQSD